MLRVIPDRAEHRDRRRSTRPHRQPPVPQGQPQERRADRPLYQLLLGFAGVSFAPSAGSIVFVLYLPAPRTLKDAAAHSMALPKLSGDHAASQAREILRI
jgi:hypothetical protein